MKPFMNAHACGTWRGKDSKISPNLGSRFFMAYQNAKILASMMELSLRAKLKISVWRENLHLEITVSDGVTTPRLLLVMQWCMHGMIQTGAWLQHRDMLWNVGTVQDGRKMTLQSTRPKTPTNKQGTVQALSKTYSILLLWRVGIARYFESLNGYFRKKT